MIHQAFHCSPRVSKIKAWVPSTQRLGGHYLDSSEICPLEGYRGEQKEWNEMKLIKYVLVLSCTFVCFLPPQSELTRVPSLTSVTKRERESSELSLPWPYICHWLHELSVGGSFTMTREAPWVFILCISHGKKKPQAWIHSAGFSVHQKTCT